MLLTRSALDWNQTGSKTGSNLWLRYRTPNQCKEYGLEWTETKSHKIGLISTFITAKSSTTPQAHRCSQLAKHYQNRDGLPRVVWYCTSMIRFMGAKDHTNFRAPQYKSTQLTGRKQSWPDTLIQIGWEFRILHTKLSPRYLCWGLVSHLLNHLLRPSTLQFRCWRKRQLHHKCRLTKTFSNSYRQKKRHYDERSQTSDNSSLIPDH